jgi:hypothetical protein
LSYFSSGTVGSGFGSSVWLEATATTDSKTRQVKKLAFDTLKHLKLNKDIGQNRRGVRFDNNESAPAIRRIILLTGQ